MTVDTTANRAPSCAGPDPADRLRFDEVWPTLAPRVSDHLARRGVPACERDDVLQETAIRLYRNWQRFDLDRALAPLAVKVATNVWLNMRDLSASRHEVPTGVVPDRAADYDVEEACTTKAELRRVFTVVRGLRSADQHAIRGIVADEVAPPATQVTDTATRVARHRARQRLLAALKYAGAFVGCLLAWLRPARRSAPLATSTGFLAVSMALIGIASLPGLAHQSRPSQPVLSDATNRTSVSPAQKNALPHGTRSTNPLGGGHAATPSGPHAKAPYWTVGDDEPAGAGVSADLDGGLIGARTNPSGSSSPICFYGPAAPAADRCDTKQPAGARAVMRH